MLGPCRRWIMIALVALCLGWHGADLRADEQTPATVKPKDEAKPKPASPQQTRPRIEQLDRGRFRQRGAATRAPQSAGRALAGRWSNRAKYSMTCGTGEAGHHIGECWRLGEEGAGSDLSTKYTEGWPKR